MKCNQMSFKTTYDAIIVKDWMKRNKRYVELQVVNNRQFKYKKVIIAYDRYVLQKYMKKLIPRNHRIAHLDGDLTNFDITNLGISYTEGPEYCPIELRNKFTEVLLDCDKKVIKKRIYYQPIDEASSKSITREIGPTIIIDPDDDWTKLQTCSFCGIEYRVPPRRARGIMDKINDGRKPYCSQICGVRYHWAERKKHLLKDETN